MQEIMWGAWRKHSYKIALAYFIKLLNYKLGKKSLQQTNYVLGFFFSSENESYKLIRLFG